MSDARKAEEAAQSALNAYVRLAAKAAVEPDLFDTEERIRSENGLGGYMDHVKREGGRLLTLEERLAPGGDLHGATASLDMGPGLGRVEVTFVEGGARLPDGTVVKVVDYAGDSTVTQAPESGPYSIRALLEADQATVRVDPTLIAEVAPMDAQDVPPAFHEGKCGEGDFADPPQCAYGMEVCPVLGGVDADALEVSGDERVQFILERNGMVTIRVAEREVARGGHLKPVTLPAGLIEGLPVAPEYHIFRDLMRDAWVAVLTEEEAQGPARLNIGSFGSGFIAPPPGTYDGDDHPVAGQDQDADQ